ncbi:cytochrome c3 family protein [Thermus filiformis]|uniref:Uncharacterized protein n=1 Tax=Thermus filiformis TaxID=276 RepID=A0A0A2WPJ1_THEFI|nr:hypothetical protein [Thermus filiformis]KGQ22096.1 hypothetical protein THFILI_10465 [Thermus filiformis]
MKRFWPLILGFGLLFAVADKEAIQKEWEKSGHNNQATLQEATVEVRGANAAHCARCHSEQGFVAWVEQLTKRNNPGNLTKPDGSPADIPYLQGLGLTKDKVKPVGCAACHTEDGDLRIVHDTPMLPAGFKATAVGEGALCITCHNTRNGRIVWNTQDPGRYTYPHASSQGDVLLGKNAFFVDDTKEWPNPHAFFTGNSCTTCHMTLHEGDYTRHTFKVPENLCASCHGAKYTEEMVQENTEHLLSLLRSQINARVLKVRDEIKTVRAYDPNTGKFTENVPVKAPVYRVEVMSVAGQIAFRMTLTDGSVLISQLGDIKNAQGKPVFPTSDPIVRASWNYLLISNDGSKGVHNPSFTRAVLTATIEALRQ